MKGTQVAVYLGAEQAKLIRWDAQEAVLAADLDRKLVRVELEVLRVDDQLEGVAA